MTRQAWLIPVLAALLAGSSAGQAAAGGAAQTTTGHFYDVDKEIRFEGTVREIVLEPRYRGAAPFLVLRVEEKGRAKTTDVEVSPSWFFGDDIHAGEKVKGLGSLSEGPDGTQTITLRDKRGFPSWQGGPRGRRGIRRFGSW